MKRIIESTRTQLESTENDQIISKINYQKSCADYEEKLIISDEMNMKMNKSLIFLKNENNNLNNGLSSAKKLLHDNQNDLIEKNTEIRRNELDLNNQKNTIEKLNISNKENEKYKELFDSLKIENLILNNDYENLFLKLQQNEEEKLKAEAKSNNTILLLDELKRIETEKAQIIITTERKNEEDLIKKDEKNDLDKNIIKQSYQLEIFNLKSNFNDTIQLLKHENNKELINKDEIRLDETNNTKILYESKLADLKTSKDKELNDLHEIYEHKFLIIENQHDNHVITLKEKFTVLAEKEKLEKNDYIQLLQNQINDLKLNNEAQFDLDKKSIEKEKTVLQKKLIVLEEKVLIYQLEREKQVDITTKYCDEKLMLEYEELFEALEILEKKFKISQNDIQNYVFLNNEFSKVFISCCDAMKYFDDTLFVLVEGTRTDASDKNQINDVSASQIIEEVMMLGMSESGGGRAFRGVNQRDSVSTFHTQHPSLIPSYHTPNGVGITMYQSTEGSTYNDGGT